MDNIILMIPTLEPGREFIDILRNYKVFFKHIVVVNDGSNQDYDEIFEEVKEMGAIVLTHALNYGKGRALKTGFNYVLNNYKDAEAVVTVDSDGQHLPEDAKKCVEAFYQSDNKLILGARNFDEANIPVKSRLGNKLTRSIMNLLCGIKVKDSQTGLRVISIDHIKHFLYTTGERFEYETNMLIDTKKHNVEIEEVEISTIYLEGNKGTHFNPLTDSLQIYKAFLKYLCVSMSSFLVDLLSFTVLLKLLPLTGSFTHRVMICNMLARVLSATYNYFLNRKVVFNKERSISFILKYAIMVSVAMCVSTTLVGMLSGRINKQYIVFIKMLIDTSIFVVNYNIQREWVFKSK